MHRTSASSLGKRDPDGGNGSEGTGRRERVGGNGLEGTGRRDRVGGNKKSGKLTCKRLRLSSSLPNLAMFEASDYSGADPSHNEVFSAHSGCDEISLHSSSFQTPSDTTEVIDEDFSSHHPSFESQHIGSHDDGPQSTTSS